MKISAVFKKLIPPIDEAAYKELRESIKRDGCKHPLVVWKEKDTLIDGHNRYEICTELGVKYEIDRRSFANEDEAIAVAITNHLDRRSLTPIQKITLHIQREDALKKIAKERQRKGRQKGGRTAGKSMNKRSLASAPIGAEANEKPLTVDDQIAQATKVGRGTVARARYVIRNGDNETKKQMIEGTISINKAYLKTNPSAGCASTMKRVKKNISKKENATSPNYTKISAMLKDYDALSTKEQRIYIKRLRTRLKKTVQNNSL